MAKTKDFVVENCVGCNEYIINPTSKINAVYLKNLYLDDINLESFKIENNTLTFLLNSGDKIIINNYSKIKYIKTDIEYSSKKELLDIISSNLVNNYDNKIDSLDKPYYNSKKQTVTGTNYSDFIDYSNSDYIPIGAKNILANKGIVINANYGNDKIIGSEYNDTIKGGVGNNTIIVENEIFGDDLVKLTKKESLTIDLTSCVDISDLSNLKFSIVGKNLIISIPNSDNSEIINGTIKLENYTKNILNSLSFNLVDDDKITFNNLNELTNALILDYNDSNLSKKKLTTTDYNDRINVENSTTSKYTINAKNGNNEINIVGGANVINSGIGNDTINVSMEGDYLISAGGGENVIEIDNSDAFGRITINEQRTNAVNKIVFLSEISNPAFEKLGNDLKIIDDNGEIIIKSYYSTVKNKSSFKIVSNDIEVDIDTFTQNTEIYVEGSGKTTGTNNDDTIFIKNSKPATITPNKGNDTILSSKGNKTIYLYEGDGEDFVEYGKGTNTVKFQNGTEVRPELQYDINGNSQIVLYYGTKGDSITFEGYNLNKKLYYYIGKKKYDVKSLFNLDKNIEITESLTIYNGSDKNDVIIDKRENAILEKIEINANSGNDYISANNAIIYAGSGNDYISASNSIVYDDKGNDIFINLGASYLNGGIGDDTIISHGNLDYCLGGGRDILYLNSGQCNLIFDTKPSSSAFSWTNDDLIINYSENNSLTIKNYSPINDKYNLTINDESFSYPDKIIYGTSNDDKFINNKYLTKLFAGNGDDIIINNADIEEIIAGKGNDTITTGINSNCNYISFQKGDGKDTLELGASCNVLSFDSNINDINCFWSNDDLIILYNNNSDSIRIKNYNPEDTNIDIYLNIQGSDKNLSQYAPDKPIFLMMSNNLDELQSQVSAFLADDYGIATYSSADSQDDSANLIAQYAYNEQ